MKKIKKPLSIILAVLMVMSVFIAVPMTASALTIDDVQSLLSSMEAKINDYNAQGDFDHAGALMNYYDWLDAELENADGQITPELESAYNEVYEYFMAGVSYPDVNNVYRATNGWVDVTVADLQPGDVLVTSDTLSVRKGDCDIVLVGGTYCEEETLSKTYLNNVTLGNNISFLFGGNYARIIDADNAKNYDPVYNNALGNAYMVIGKENGTVYLAGYYFTIYTVTWKNGDDVIKTDTVEEGAAPAYSGDVPEKAEDENYTYTFSGWTDGTTTYGATDTLPAVTGDITYTATFTSTRKDITGSFGNLNWCIDADGVLTFSGSGALPMDAFNKNGDVKKVIINDSVTALGAYAFCECPNLREVDIQNPSVSLAGTSNNFSYSGVTTVTLPEGMTTIPQDMFKACGALTTVDLPSTITSIAGGAFWNSGLQSISVPEGATYDSSSFETNSLRSLTLEGSSPKTFTGGEFTFLSDAATVYIPEGSTYVYSTTTATLYVKDPSNERAQSMLQYAQEYFNRYIGYGLSPEQALVYINRDFQDGYGVNVTTEGPFTVTLNEGDKCEAVFGGATISTFPLNYTVTWKNGETVLKTDTVEGGTAPAYSGDVPEKAEDEDYTYTFSGWTDGTTTYGATDTLPAVTGDITYTATYTASAKSAKTIAAGETYYIGDSIAFTDAPPFVYVRYDDDTYGDYTAYLIGGDNTTVTAPTYDSRGGQWKFNDVLRYEPWASARPLRITDTNDRTPIGFKCSGGTGTSSDPFTFECVYESAPELFPQHSVSLGGDIGVNFYIDPAAANADEDATVSVEFSWNGQSETVTAEYDDSKGLFKATCDVVAAEVACDITAVATVNGEVQAETDTYSVQDYAETVYKNPEAYDKKGKPEKLQELAKALLNYGAMAQTVFVEYMKQPVKDPAKIVSTVGETNFNDITADDIPGEATDLKAFAEQLGFKYYTSSVLYLSKNTLRLYFTPNTYQDAMPHVNDFKGNQSNYYYYVEKENIAAAELDDQQSFTIGDTTFTFSALDYAKAVVNSGMGGDQKDLAKALYLYNKAANEYFDDAPAPVENVVDLGTLTGDYEAKNNDVLIGTLSGNKKITIADGATVTLRDVNITNLGKNCDWAGINCPGNATLVLEGENEVCAGLDGDGYNNYPGIWIAPDKTLTIEGDGSLTAYSNNTQPYGAGIGGGFNIAAGNIVIKGGTIIANGGSNAAGIGSGQAATCGNILITGGTVTANGGQNAAGIGSGFNAPCGNITIDGGNVTATGGQSAAGIGSGLWGNCGYITIANTVTSVTATKGAAAPNSIGAGVDASCGTVTIEDGANVTQN